MNKENIIKVGGIAWKGLVFTASLANVAETFHSLYNKYCKKAKKVSGFKTEPEN